MDGSRKSRLNSWSTALALAVTFVPAAQAAPTIDDYGALPEIQAMAISPNGDLIAYRNVTADGDTLRVISLKESKAVTAVDIGSIKARDIFFVNNEQVMLRAAKNTRVEGFRGRFDVSTVFSLDFESGKIKQLLVPGDGVVYPGQQGLGRIVGVSPDGKYVYMPAYYGKPQMVMGDWADPLFALLRVPVKGAGKPKRVKSGSHSTDDYFVDSEGTLIALEEFDETDNVHRVVARKGKDWNEIYRDETRLRNRSFVGLTPDRQHLVVLDISDETGRRSYFTLSLDTGEIAGPLYGRDDADIVRIFTDVQRVVHGLQYSGLTPAYRFFDDGLDQRVKDIQNFFPEHSVYIADYSPDWKHILIRMEGSQSSGEYYLFSEGEKPRYLAAQRPRIPPESVNPIGMVTFSARDGLTIPTVVTIPRERASDMHKLPAVVLPHGGPASYDEINFDFLAQALATQGYLVIMPQFRGSSGFGIEHKVAGYGEWGGKMQDDVSDAVQYFADKGMIDPGHVCIVGGSYGGYAALAGGAFSPELYRCVVSINGIGDLGRFHDWILNEQGRSSESLAYWELQIGNENYSKESARERSPEFSVDRYSAPVLLIHSREDEIVPVSQSERMYKALRKAGKEVQLLTLDGDDHYLSLGDMRTEALKATVDFVNDNL